jgi:hypothetical protein
MTYTSNEYISMHIHKAREQQLLEEANNQRLAQSLREQVENRVRRTIRISNDRTR